MHPVELGLGFEQSKELRPNNRGTGLGSGQHEGIGFREVSNGDGTVPATMTAAAAEEIGPSPRTKNPFIIILWALSGVLILGGLLALLNGSLEVSMTQRVSMADILFTFAPQSVFIGVTTVIALMFWHAWRWQRGQG